MSKSISATGCKYDYLPYVQGLGNQ